MRYKKRKKPPVARKDTSYKKKKVYLKKAKVARQKVPRTRNLGTMTESQYFQKIRSSLRRAFRWWKPMLKVLEDSSRPYVGPNKRQKKEYLCNSCKNWFKRTDVEIDHVEECGSLSCYADIPQFIQRLTREELSAYQVLCKDKCHKEKTLEYKLNKK